MMLTVFREKSTQGATLSRLFNGLDFICDVLEDEVREVPGKPVEFWKIPGTTAIPYGIYKVTLESSQRFGPDTITLNDVPGFKYIRGHAGNTSKDTEGCLLFGTRNSSYTVRDSRIALQKVKALIKAEIVKGKPVSINITKVGE